MRDEGDTSSSRPVLQRFLAGRRSERFERVKKPIVNLRFDCAMPNTSTASESSSGIVADIKSEKSTKKRTASPYRISDTPRFVMAGLADLVGRARSPSFRKR
ncbi:unnamed protein product [Toxocara canis]|uniref:Uncharacterized protein n=1 Tax=Toxocara canis TaxID=6265 RepID=A0A183V8K8_TOXCA|nr:unnamed protein product [Toxocara canis]